VRQWKRQVYKWVEAGGGAAEHLQATFLTGGGFGGPFLLSLAHFDPVLDFARLLVFLAWSQDYVVLNGGESFFVPGTEPLCHVQTSVPGTDLCTFRYVSYMIPMRVAISTVGTYIRNMSTPVSSK
jgi:hypothetical protein